MTMTINRLMYASTDPDGRTVCEYSDCKELAIGPIDAEKLSATYPEISLGGSWFSKPQVSGDFCKQHSIQHLEAQKEYPDPRVQSLTLEAFHYYRKGAIRRRMALKLSDIRCGREIARLTGRGAFLRFIRGRL